MSAPSPRAFSCAIIFNDTVGLKTDAAVLTEAIVAARPGAVVIHFNLQGQFRQDRTLPVTVPPNIQQLLPLDAVFLLEHVHTNPPFLDGFARRQIYIPNIEWLDAQDEAALEGGVVDTVLFKNSFSEHIFSRLPFAGRVRQRFVTGWTSRDIGLRPADTTESVQRAIHVRGSSSHKQTAAVIATWLRDAAFPQLDVIATLIDHFEVPVPLRAAGNLVVHMRPLPEPELQAMQRAAAIHVSPSNTEGFGHVLNEARAAGAVLITCDAPPMNELVEDGRSGILVPVDASGTRPFRRSRTFTVRGDDLEAAIRRALALTGEQRRQMGLNARRRFEQERQGFYANIASVLA